MAPGPMSEIVLGRTMMSLDCSVKSEMCGVHSLVLNEVTDSVKVGVCGEFVETMSRDDLGKFTDMD
jgi:hypothetical protein